MGSISPNEAWQSFKGRIASRRTRNAPEMPTGIEWIDKHTDGIQRGQVWIIAGYSGVGKTSLATQILGNVVENPKRNALMISLEMTASQVMGRMFSQFYKIDFNTLRKGDHIDNWKALDDKFEEYCDTIGLDIVDNKGYTFQEVVDIIEKEYKDKKPDLIVLDFVQLISTVGYARDHDALSEFVRKMAELAKKENIAILLLSQLRRPPSGTSQHKKPELSDLAGSGMLERLAHVVLFTYREVKKSFGKITNKVFVTIAKNRDGEGAGIEKEFIFDGNIFTFREKEEQWSDM